MLGAQQIKAVNEKAYQEYLQRREAEKKETPEPTEEK